MKRERERKKYAINIEDDCAKKTDIHFIILYMAHDDVGTTFSDE